MSADQRLEDVVHGALHGANAAVLPPIGAYFRARGRVWVRLPGNPVDFAGAIGLCVRAARVLELEVRHKDTPPWYRILEEPEWIQVKRLGRQLELPDASLEVIVWQVRSEAWT